MERPVGEIFKYENVNLEVVEQQGCRGCRLEGSEAAGL